MDPAWSPDGTRIAFTSNRDPWVFAINVMNADGSDVTRLNANAMDGEAEPAWSPEGTRIAFTYFVDGMVNIGVRDLVDGSLFAVAVDVWGPCGLLPNPAWSPDGDKLAYTASGSDPADCVISAVKLDDFSHVAITEGFDPSWRR
jgi:Tol biopolymer transport system component